MRLFLAIPLPKSLRRELLKTVEPLRRAIRGKWVEEENLHLTLAFLGEVPEARVEAAAAALQGAAEAVPGFSLTLGEVAPIPPRRPSAVAVQVAPEPNAKRLQQLTAAAIRRLGLPVSVHDLHLTLVRPKGIAPALPGLPVLNRSFYVGEITLFQSTLTPKGPIYRPLKALKLRSRTVSARLRPVVAICLLNPKNEVLLVWHKEHKQNAWQFPQGGVENADGLEATARRELREEVGITSFELLALKKSVYAYRWPRQLVEQGTDPRKKPFVGQEVSLAVARVKEARPKLTPDPREAAKVAWVPVSKLLKHLGPVRRGIGRIAMVELKRLGLTPRPLR